MDQPLVILALGSAIVFAAFLIRGLSGIGSALVCIPLLALFWDLKIVVPLEAMLEVGFSLLVVGKLFRHMRKDIILYVIIGAALGSLAGVFLLSSLPNYFLQKALGGTVLVFSVYLLKPNHQTARHLSHYWGVAAGLLGGLLGGLFGTSGPPMAWYMVYRLHAKDILRASLIGLLALDFAWRVAIYTATGLITVEVLQLGLVFLPAMALGTFAGNRAVSRISDIRFRQLVAFILACSGVLLLLN
jgi:uncharacterized membrane protein YfcA